MSANMTAFIACGAFGLFLLSRHLPLAFVLLGVAAGNFAAVMGWLA